eukprot:GILK01009259.1.p1 GENE.GILK01009259.1~~GILK01009259.1.p1  ORF type:complete len:530 (+),score=86.20 GILK01009259.1:37-1590(+)
MTSLGYAERLSSYDRKGKCGAKEYFDGKRVLQNKIDKLAELIRQSNYIVAHTGAGISTAVGIPDFRGPKGVWTLVQKGKLSELPMNTTFEEAVPSFAHMVLLALIQWGKLKFIVSQNVDGLHRRSGVPRHCLAELHGNMFTEVCDVCGTEYFRDFDLQGVGLKYTGRVCEDPYCKRPLRDTVLDWEDELPEKDLMDSEKHCDAADLSIALGTSLQINPARNLPLRTLKRQGKFVIINLQKTPHEKRASLCIHGKVDEVLAGVVQRLNLAIPIYTHAQIFRIKHEPVSESTPGSFHIMLSVTGELCDHVANVSKISCTYANLPVQTVSSANYRFQFLIGGEDGVKLNDGSLVHRFTFILEFKHSQRTPVQVDYDIDLDNLKTIGSQLYEADCITIDYNEEEISKRFPAVTTPVRRRISSDLIGDPSSDVSVVIENNRPQRSGVKRQREVDSDSESAGELWIRCDEKACKKWRYVSPAPQPLPRRWYCSMNPDPIRNSCSSLEEPHSTDPSDDSDGSDS